MIRFFKFDGMLVGSDKRQSMETDKLLSLTQDLRKAARQVMHVISNENGQILFDFSVFKNKHLKTQFQQTEYIRNFRIECSTQAKHSINWINLTTGTWPSPYWLLYGDSIWRGGYDTGLCETDHRGQSQSSHCDGSDHREQWITYR